MLGVVAGAGQLAFLRPHVPVTGALVEALRMDGAPIENRVRFAGPCFGAKCVQWAEGRCGLIDKIIAAPAPTQAPLDSLPRCGIRSTCRWFMQHGRAACEACPTVVRKPAEA
jgi:hypothetical protein